MYADSVRIHFLFILSRHGLFTSCASEAFNQLIKQILKYMQIWKLGELKLPPNITESYLEADRIQIFCFLRQKRPATSAVRVASLNLLFIIFESDLFTKSVGENPERIHVYHM